MFAKPRLVQFLTLVFIALSLFTTAHSATVYVTPDTVDEDFVGDVQVTISLTAPGNSVYVSLFVDANADMNVNVEDIFMRGFSVVDGGSVPLGHPRLFHDLDGTANGVIKGRFNLTWPGVVGHWLMIAEEAGAAPGTASLTITHRNATETAFGKVEDEMNHPLAGVVIIVQMAQVERDVSAIVTDQNGEFEIAFPDPGAYDVFAVKPGHLTRFSQGSARRINISAGQTVRNQNLTLYRGNRTINGVIYDQASRAGIPGISISAFSPSGVFALSITNPEGEYSLASTDTWWQFQADHAQISSYGYVAPLTEYSIQVSGSDVYDMNVGLRRYTALVSGKVVDKVSQLPIPGIMVYCYRDRGRLIAVDQTDENGNYYIGVISGDWVLNVDEEQVQEMGYLEPTPYFETIRDGDILRDKDFELETFTSMVKGHVTDGLDPIEQVWVRVESPQSGGQWVRTDRQGYYEVGVIEGFYRVELEATQMASLGLIPPSPEHVYVANGAEVVVDLVVERGNARISGVVLAPAPSTQPLEGVYVLGQTHDKGYIYLPTDRNGEYELPLVEGPWYIQVLPEVIYQMGYFPPPPYIVDVQRGDQLQHDFILQNSNGRIRGKITHEGTPVEGAYCNATYRDYVWLNQESAPDGNYVFKAREGKWVVQLDEVQITKEGGVCPAPYVFDLNAGQTFVANFNIRNPNAWIYGHVTLDGQPQPKMWVVGRSPDGFSIEKQNDDTGYYRAGIRDGDWEFHLRWEELTPLNLVPPPHYEIDDIQVDDNLTVDFPLYTANAGLKGKVTEGDGVTPVKEAIIVASNSNISYTTAVMSEGQGKYYFPLRVGTWDVFAMKDRYFPSRTHTITITQPGQEVTLDLKLSRGRAPYILMAGYMNTEMTTQGGGTLEILAWVSDPDGDAISEVEVLYEGRPTGLVLPEFFPQTGVYWLQNTTIDPGVPAGQFMFELVARDATGMESGMWPYLSINAGHQPAPAKALVNKDHWLQLYQSVAQDGLVSNRKAQANRPSILAAGYYDTYLSELDGGMMTIMAAISHPRGQGYISSVELLHQGIGTGVMLEDNGQSGDFDAGDSVYGFQLSFAPGDLVGLAGRFSFELVARDYNGAESTRWPYATVE